MEYNDFIINVKVMRLNGLTLANPSLPVTTDSTVQLGDLLDKMLQMDSKSVSEAASLSIGQFLLLPMNVVKLYLGETLSCSICVSSDSILPVDNLALTVKLQTASKSVLLSANPPTVRFGTEDILNVVIHHVMQEIGANILVCEVKYQLPCGASKLLRKCFELEVLKPIDVETIFCNAEDGDVCLEAQIQNITNRPIWLEKVAVDAFYPYNVASLNTTPSGKSVFGKTTVLQPQNIHQFLYCFSPDPKLSKNLKLLDEATSLGKLDIVWTPNLGEKGRLLSTPLQKINSECEDIRLWIVEMPTFVILEKPFTLKCRIANKRESSVDLTISLQDRDSITWCGEYSKQVTSVIESQATLDVELKAIPLVPGFQAVSGIALYDPILKRNYKFQELGHVFVILNNDEISSQ